jgi:hypothetical protein
MENQTQRAAEYNEEDKLEYYSPPPLGGILILNPLPAVLALIPAAAPVLLLSFADFRLDAPPVCLKTVLHQTRLLASSQKFIYPLFPSHSRVSRDARQGGVE